MEAGREARGEETGSVGGKEAAPGGGAGIRKGAARAPMGVLFLANAAHLAVREVKKTQSVA
jgi:hypothetical protein